MKKRLTVILGMHRSGTSLLSAGLSSIGVNFGDELMEGGRGNIKGHWEDKDIVALNNRVLKHLGLRWDSVEWLNDTIWNAYDFKSLIDEAVIVLNRKLEASQLNFGFKDPRTIRVLPFWFSVFSEMSIQPKFVLMLRNPLDVCNSLYKRDKKIKIESQILWLHHNLNYVHALGSVKKDLYLVDFYEFCKSPLDCLFKLSTYLDEEFNEERVNQFCYEFYDEALISKLTDPYQLSESAKIWPLCIEVYLKMRAMRGNDFSSDYMEGLYSQWFKGYSLVVQELLLINASPSNYEKNLFESNLQNFNLQIKRLQKQISDIEHISLKFSSKSLDELVSAQKQEVKKIESSISGNPQETLHLAKEIQQLNRDVLTLSEVAKNSVVRLENEQEWFLQLNHLSEKIENIANRVKENDSSRDELRKTQQKLERVTRHNTSILSSFSWKITAPVRMVVSFLTGK